MALQQIDFKPIDFKPVEKPAEVPKKEPGIFSNRAPIINIPENIPEYQKIPGKIYNRVIQPLGDPINAAILGLSFPLLGGLNALYPNAVKIGLGGLGSYGAVKGGQDIAEMAKSGVNAEKAIDLIEHGTMAAGLLARPYPRVPVTSPALPAEKVVIKGLLEAPKPKADFITTPKGVSVANPDTADFLTAQNARVSGSTVSKFDIPSLRATGEVAELTPNAPGVGVIIGRGELPATQRTGLGFAQGDSVVSEATNRGPVRYGPNAAGKSAPILTGDTSGGLGYPLDVVPNRLRPSSVQTVEASLGATQQERPISTGTNWGGPSKTVKAGEGLTAEEVATQEPIARLAEELGPSAIRGSRAQTLAETAAYYREHGQAVPENVTRALRREAAKTVAQETAVVSGDDIAVLEEALASDNPLAAESAYKYAQEVNRAGRFATAGNEFKSMGPEGVELYRRGARVVQRERFNLHDWAESYKNAIEKLSRDEFNNFSDYVTGERPVPNTRVARAVNAWKRAEQLAGAEGEASGMIIKQADGSTRPFKRLADYWPKRLTKESLKNLPERVDQMLADNQKEIAKAIAKGETPPKKLTRDAATRMMKNARERGELVLPSQHARVGNFLDFDKSARSGLVHLEQMARRTAETREFGRLDVAGHGSKGVADLIEKTSNPGRAMEIMQRVIGRDEKVIKSLDDGVRRTRTAVSWLRLQFYGISSIIGNQLPNLARASAKDYVRSLGAFIGKNKGITDPSAVYIDVSHGFFEATKSWNSMKIYGGQWAENIVRRQAAIIGESLAKGYFKTLKTNPGNASARKQLFELILEPVEKVIQQGKLTPDQLRMAAGRNAEISQGLTTPLNMPMFASTPVSNELTALGQILMIFKKQPFIQSKMIKDAFKLNPIKTLAVLGLGGQAAGAGITGVKSTIIGTGRSLLGKAGVGSYNPSIKDSVKWEQEHRADYVKRITGSDNEALNHAVDRMLNSWALGIGTDILSLALSEGKIAEFIAGPAFGAAGDIIGNLNNPKQLGRETLKMLPVPLGGGTVLQRQLLPTESQTPKDSFGFKPIKEGDFKPIKR